MRILGMDVGWFFKLLVSFPLLFLGSDTFHSGDRESEAILFFCKKYDVDPILVKAILEVEGENINSIDYLQDLLLESQLARHDSTWWENWATRHDSIANNYLPLRSKSGKWPVSLYSSLYVVSFGPAQITPRTIWLGRNSHGTEL